jgi:hypothetical protein
VYRGFSNGIAASTVGLPSTSWENEYYRLTGGRAKGSERRSSLSDG